MSTGCRNYTLSCFQTRSLNLLCRERERSCSWGLTSWDSPVNTLFQAETRGRGEDRFQLQIFISLLYSRIPGLLLVTCNNREQPSGANKRTSPGYLESSNEDDAAGLQGCRLPPPFIQSFSVFNMLRDEMINPDSAQTVSKAWAPASHPVFNLSHHLCASGNNQETDEELYFHKPSGAVFTERLIS